MLLEFEGVDVVDFEASCCAYSKAASVRIETYALYLFLYFALFHLDLLMHYIRIS